MPLAGEVSGSMIHAVSYSRTIGSLKIGKIIIFLYSGTVSFNVIWAVLGDYL
jgi:hypothetical protein